MKVFTRIFFSLAYLLANGYLLADSYSETSTTSDSIIEIDEIGNQRQGVPFEITIRSMDERANEGEVFLYFEAGSIAPHRLEMKNGIAKAMVKVNELGHNLSITAMFSGESYIKNEYYESNTFHVYNSDYTILENGSLKGHVVMDSDSIENPGFVEGVKVELLFYNKNLYSDCRHSDWNIDDEKTIDNEIIAYTTFSDVNGLYEFSTYPGQYVLRLTHEDFFTDSVDILIPPQREVCRNSEIHHTCEWHRNHRQERGHDNDKYSDDDDDDDDDDEDEDEDRADIRFITLESEGKVQHEVRYLGNENIPISTGSSIDSCDTSIQDPIDGEYEIRFFAHEEGMYNIEFMYMDCARGLQLGFRGEAYLEGKEKRIRFKINREEDPKRVLIMSREMLTPYYLEMRNRDDKTFLYWQDSFSDIREDVEAYEVFVKEPNETEWSLYKKTTEKSLLTDHKWNDDSDYEYLVRAVLKNGTVTFFSDRAFDWGDDDDNFDDEDDEDFDIDCLEPIDLDLAKKSLLVPPSVGSRGKSLKRTLKTPFRKVNSLLDNKIPQIYFGSYGDLPDDVVMEKTGKIFSDYQAEFFECQNDNGKQMDVIYISSPFEDKTNNAIVICSPTAYLDYSTKSWEPFLKAGADVVLWNPTQDITPQSYSNDLTALLRKIKNSKPVTALAVKTHCATTDPAIKSVADMNDENIHIIIDRGYGDAYTLARSYTPLVKFPFIKSIIHNKADCNGREKIKEIRGKVLFIHTNGSDQVMDYGIFKKKNLTRELEKERPDAWIVEMDTERDHWASWTRDVYEVVHAFLEEQMIVSENRSSVEEDKIPHVVHGERWKSIVSKMVKKFSFYF